jgi:hypothetical protein
MLPEVGEMTTYDRNLVYSGIIDSATKLCIGGVALSAELQNDLVELEDTLKDEIAEVQASYWKRHPHPITLQNWGRLITLRSHGAIDQDRSSAQQLKLFSFTCD